MRKLLVIIAGAEDVEDLMSAIVALGERATRVAGTGGFLQQEGAVVLSCVAPHRVADVLAAVRGICHRRTTFLIPPSLDYGALPVEAVEVEVGGAVVFVLDVERTAFLADGADRATRAGRPAETRAP
ncbi:MAG: cyclic-di-AMP receptor [Chloroflexi bacterium]|nr:cyclic-di-AMP receptor [Chloroflexota bacterium]